MYFLFYDYLAIKFTINSVIEYLIKGFCYANKSLCLKLSSHFKIALYPGTLVSFHMQSTRV